MTQPADTVVLRGDCLIPLDQAVAALTQYRHKSGLSRRAAGENVGKSQQWVSGIEDQPHSPTLRRLNAYAEALGVELRIVLCRKTNT